MGDTLLNRFRPAVSVAPLTSRDLAKAHALCAERPAAYVMPMQGIESAHAVSRGRVDNVWGVYVRRGSERALVGAVWAGANVVPALPGASADLVARVAEVAARRMPRPTALVGEADVVRQLWHNLEGAWGPARVVRDPQIHMTLAERPEVTTPEIPGVTWEPVRRAVAADFDALLPAAVDMFTTEVGYNPLEVSPGPYRDRLEWLVRAGRSFVQYAQIDNRRTLVFKAEVGALTSGNLASTPHAHRGSGVAELQGVWVHPQMRGHGVGRAAVAQTTALVQQWHAPVVSLYVNGFNTPALRMYESVGFGREGDFVSVML